MAGIVLSGRPKIDTFVLFYYCALHENVGGCWMSQQKRDRHYVVCEVK